MEIERAKKLLKSGVEAGNKVKAVRELIKTYKNQKQDQYDDTAEILAPTIDTQMKEKETIDKKQDKVIEELKKNQKALTAGIADIVEANQRAIMFDRELPQLPAPTEEQPMIEFPGEKKQITILDIDNNFNKDDRIIIDNYKLLRPKDLTQVTPDRLMEERQRTVEIVKKLGGLKRRKYTTEYDIQSYNMELQTMKKYRETINDVIKSLKYRPQTGQGRYTQKKRNAYKISHGGRYGNLLIDLPKLYGELKVIAHKNGQKIYDRAADFDTIDLLTKRFNSGKNYSNLAKSIFNDLNKLSAIPIHWSSKKYSKIGSGVVYYNNPKDLLSRLELLGGSMSAGNSSQDVKEEFANIVHKLNKLNVIDMKQMNDLMKEYLI